MAFITDLTAAVPTTGVYIDGLPSGVDNRQGSIRGGGTIADSTNFATTTFGEGNPITTIVSGINNTTAITAGAWNSGVQVMSLDQTIAGATSTALQGGSSNSANDAFTPLQQGLGYSRQVNNAIRAGYYNMYNGTFLSTVEKYVVNDFYKVYSISQGAVEHKYKVSGTDIAANPTQNIPGRITIRDGSANPVQTGYQPRNNW